MRRIESVSPRANRARRFAHQIMHALDDFLPRDRKTQARIYTHLVLLAYESNAEIINVPPEYDALNRMQIERAMVENHPVFIGAFKGNG